MVNFINWQDENEVKITLESLLRLNNVPSTHYLRCNNLKFYYKHTREDRRLYMSVPVKLIDDKSKIALLKDSQPYMSHIKEILKNPEILEFDDFKWDVFMAGFKK